jgi:hypothetical protein
MRSTAFDSMRRSDVIRTRHKERSLPIGEESLNLVQVDESNGADAPDPDSLTAMWCLLDEETQAQGGVAGSTTATVGDSGTFWDVEGVQAEEYWPQSNSREQPLIAGLPPSAHIMPIPPDISSAYPPTPLSVDPSGLPAVADGDGRTAL